MRAGNASTIALAVLLTLPPAAPSAHGTTAFDTQVKPVLARTCYTCHNDYVRNADLNLAAHATEAAIVANPRTWEKVAEKVRTRVMPPPGFPPVTEAERKAMVEWIETTLARADALAPPNPGRVTARRLNRTEYDNSVRDLLGVELRPALDFPQDDTGYGFDNNGDVLSLSPRSWRSTCSPRRGSRARRSSGRIRPRPASCASRPCGPRSSPRSLLFRSTTSRA